MRRTEEIAPMNLSIIQKENMQTARNAPSAADMRHGHRMPFIRMAPTGHGRCACFRINFRLSERIARMRQRRSRFLPRPQEGEGTRFWVDTPDHDATIDTFDAAHIASILQVLQDRLHFFRNRADTQYVQIFKNCGPSTGMSMHHSHWQVVGLPVVPKRAATMAEAMHREDCLFCKMLAYEKETNRRIVAETEHFLARPTPCRRRPELLVCRRHISVISAR